MNTGFKKLIALGLACSVLGGAFAFAADTAAQNGQNPALPSGETESVDAAPPAEAQVLEPASPAELIWEVDAQDLAMPRAAETYTITNWKGNTEYIIFDSKDLVYKGEVQVTGAWNDSGAKLTLILYFKENGVWKERSSYGGLTTGKTYSLNAWDNGIHKLVIIPSGPIENGTLRVTC